MARDRAGWNFGIKMFAKTSATQLAEKKRWSLMDSNLAAISLLKIPKTAPPSDGKKNLKFFSGFSNLFYYKSKTSWAYVRAVKSSFLGTAHPIHTIVRNWLIIVFGRPGHHKYQLPLDLWRKQISYDFKISRYQSAVWVSIVRLY